MESIDAPQHLAPRTSFYWIQDSELRERRLHVPAHTGSEDESVDLEKSKDPRVHHSTIIKHDVDSPVSEHSSDDQQDQQQAIEGHHQPGSRHSSGFGSGSKRCPGSLDAAPPCFSSSDEELAQLAVGSNELPCSGSPSPYLPHQQDDKSLPLSPTCSLCSRLVRAKDSITLTESHTSLKQSPIGYLCAGCTDSAGTLASKTQLSETSVPENSVPSLQDSSPSVIATTSSLVSVPHRTPTPISVTITTTEIGTITSNSESKTYYYARAAQHQRQRQQHSAARRLVRVLEVQPLWCLHQDQEFTVPSDLRKRILKSFDYLEYLETSLLPDKEVKALKRRKRIQSWITIKDFVSFHLGLTKDDHSNHRKSKSHRKSTPTFHLNHSTPLIDRQLLSPSPSPSLPLSRPAWNTTRSGQSSRASSIVGVAGPSRQQTTNRAFARGHSRATTLQGVPSSSSLSLSSIEPSPFSFDIRALAPRTPSPSSSASPFTSPSPSPAPSLSGRRRLSSRSSWPRKLPSFLSRFRHSPSSSSSSSSSAHTPTYEPLARLQEPRFHSSISVTSTASISSSSTSNSNAHNMSHNRPTILSHHTSPSLTSLASTTVASCSSSMNPHTNTSAYATIRTPARKVASGQHPLAIVSTFESDDHDSASIAETTPETSRNLGTFITTVSTQTAETTTSAGERSKDILLAAGARGKGRDSKQSDLSKSTLRPDSQFVYMLHTKSETSVGVRDVTQHVRGRQDAAEESDWTMVTVASGVDQPISPLAGSRSTMVSPLVFPHLAEHDSGAQEVDRSQTPPPTTDAEEPVAPTTPPKRPDFEMWTPPPPRERPVSQQYRHQERQPHSRLPISRLLKQRSFYFPFSSPSSPLSGGSSSQQNGSNHLRASTDGLSGGVESGAENHARGAASCDIPRPVGPPDPIPPYYQHLQNRNRLSFRRRSHGGEMDRIPTGWIVNEGAIAPQSGPRIPVGEDPSSTTMPQPVPRRHASTGVQPSSRWGRLLTSFFPGSGSESGDQEPSNRESDGVSEGIYLSQQRLLLATSNQYQQQLPHPMYQQQLFFYADEVLGRTESDNYASQDEDYMYRGHYSSEGNSDQDDAPSFARLSLGAMEANAALQGELAQEDRHESMEVMNSTTEPMFVRPTTPSMLASDGFVVPISSDGRIPVSSLALSSPPSYWETAIKYQGWPKIEPRPEQGQEALPRYTCSVFREGCVNRKTELVGNWRPYLRPWKRTFAHLRGTALRLYAVDAEDVPRLHVRNISLQMAKVEMATDYKQRPNVIRIEACDRTILIECKDRIDALTWFEHLQAAANIASTLEDRAMPKFCTLPRAPPAQLNNTRRNSGTRSNSNTSSTISNRNQPTDSPQQEQPQQPQHLPRPLPSPSRSRPPQPSLDLTAIGPQYDETPNSVERPPRSPRSPRRPRHASVGSVSASSPTQATSYQQLQHALQSQQDQVLMYQNRVHQQQRVRQHVPQSNVSASVLEPSALEASALDHHSHSPSSRDNHRRRESDSSASDNNVPQQRRLSQSRVQRRQTTVEDDQRRESALREEDAVTRSVLLALGHSSESGSDSDDDQSSDDDDDFVPRRRSQTSNTNSNRTSLAAFRERQQQQLQLQHREESRQGTVAPSNNNVPAPVSPRSANHRERYRQVEEQVRAYRGEDWEQAYTVYARQQELQSQQREQELRRERRQEERRQRASWNRRFFLGIWGQHDPTTISAEAEAQAQQHAHGHDQPLALAACT